MLHSENSITFVEMFLMKIFIKSPFNIIRFCVIKKSQLISRKNVTYRNENISETYYIITSIHLFVYNIRSYGVILSWGGKSSCQRYLFCCAISLKMVVGKYQHNVLTINRRNFYVGFNFCLRSHRCWNFFSSTILQKQCSQCSIHTLVCLTFCEPRQYSFL